MDILYIPQLDEIGTDGGDSGGSTGSSRYRLLKRVPEDGVVLLTDSAVTRVELATSEPVRFVLPPLVKGQVRDFFARIVITADEIPELTFAAPTGETVSFEDADEDIFKCETAINIFAFTETDEGIFMVNRRQIDIEFEVAFDACGGEMAGGATRAYLLGAPYGTLPEPSFIGYDFLGWFTDAEGGAEVVASDRCKTEVATLYAHWAVYADPFVNAICAAGNLTFRTSGDAEWWIDPDTFVTGSGSARSGIISDNQSSSLKTTLQGPGTIAFKWKASSESGYDKLVFWVDGEAKANISGEEDWMQISVTVEGDGTHTAEWRYTKDTSVAKGSDCGWVDDVVWTPEGGS